MLPIMQYRNALPDHQATAPVYLAAIRKHDWKVVYRQVLTEQKPLARYSRPTRGIGPDTHVHHAVL
jgi:hypothetical protein